MKRTAELIKHKFQELVFKKIQQVTPIVLLIFVRPSKFQGKIVIATNGLTGGSDSEVESITSNGAREDENGMDEEANDAEFGDKEVSPLPVPPNRYCSLL
jgi:hypothetical protein